MAQGTFHVLITGKPHFGEQVSLAKHPRGRGDHRMMDVSVVPRNKGYWTIHASTAQQDDYLKVTVGTMPVVFDDTSESAAMPGHEDVACCTEIFDPQDSNCFACRGRIRRVAWHQQARIFFQ